MSSAEINKARDFPVVESSCSLFIFRARLHVHDTHDHK